MFLIHILHFETFCVYKNINKCGILKKVCMHTLCSVKDVTDISDCFYFLQDEDLPAEFDDIPEDDISHILESRQRQEMIERFLEESARMQEYRPYEYTPTEIIKKYKGKIIDFSELEIVGIIGHGGFGEVYFAYLDGEAVAVKKLKFQQLTKRRLELFIKEMEVFLELEHDNIVSFLGACTKIPNLAIVMELMDTSLYDALHVKPVIRISYIYPLSFS